MRVDDGPSEEPGLARRRRIRGSLLHQAHGRFFALRPGSVENRTMPVIPAKAGIHLLLG